jgi:tetratricopeptide (TPR) repeat protein
VVPCFMHNPMDPSPSRPPSAGLSGTLWRSIQGRVSSLAGRRGAGLRGRNEGVEVAAAASPGPPEEHPAAEEVERLFRGDLPVEAVRRILAHLLPGCPVCQEHTADLWRRGLETASAATAPAADGSQYDAAVGQVFERIRQARRRLETERAEACEALQELEAHSQARRRLLVQNRPGFQSWGVCEGLLARAEEGAALSVAWAELAVAVARQLDPARYPAPSLHDLQARSWTALADAHRRRGELSAAEEALGSAWERLGRGTGDRVERARLLDAESSLRRAQGREREAARQLDRAIRLYHRTGQRHLWSRALIRQGHARVQAGDLEGGIELVHEALQGGDPDTGLGVWVSWRRASSLAVLQGLAGRFRRARRTG